MTVLASELSGGVSWELAGGSPSSREALILMQPCSKAVLGSVDAGAVQPFCSPAEEAEDPIKRSRAWWVPVGAELLVSAPTLSL